MVHREVMVLMVRSMVRHNITVMGMVTDMDMVIKVMG
jgi:hypothetical protein